MILELKSWLVDNRKALIFGAKLIGLYIALQSLYDYILIPYTNIDYLLIQNIIDTSQKIIAALGYELLNASGEYQYQVGINNTSGVVIGNPCDGLSLFILYSAFIVVFQGKWYFKGLYILMGIGLIHMLNVLRIISLVLIVLYYPQTLDFHHSYTFTLLIYLFIFLLWKWRIQLFHKRQW